MRERIVVGPLLAFYWWVREYPATKTPADLRFEARLWQFAGHRSLARLCRLEAEVTARDYKPMDRLDALGLAMVAALLAATVLVLVGQLLRAVIA